MAGSRSDFASVTRRGCAVYCWILTVGGELTAALFADTPDTEEHDKHVRLLNRGFASMCVALHRIREGKTYKSAGHGSYGAFLKDYGISNANGRLFANIGPTMVLLYESGEAALIKHPDMLKPIYKLPSANRQAQIVRVAKRQADQLMIPLTADVIADVAEKQFGWKRESVYRQKKQPEEMTPGPERLKSELESAFRVIAGCGYAGYDITTAIGDPSRLDSFTEALRVMHDMEDA